MRLAWGDCWCMFDLDGCLFFHSGYYLLMWLSGSLVRFLWVSVVVTMSDCEFEPTS